jgi:hypothetical protein
MLGDYLMDHMHYEDLLLPDIYTEVMLLQRSGFGTPNLMWQCAEQCRVLPNPLIMQRLKKIICNQKVPISAPLPPETF